MHGQLSRGKAGRVAGQVEALRQLQVPPQNLARCCGKVLSGDMESMTDKKVLSYKGKRGRWANSQFRSSTKERAPTLPLLRPHATSFSGGEICAW